MAVQIELRTGPCAAGPEGISMRLADARHVLHRDLDAQLQGPAGAAHPRSSRAATRRERRSGELGPQLLPGRLAHAMDPRRLRVEASRPALLACTATGGRLRACADSAPGPSGIARSGRPSRLGQAVRDGRARRVRCSSRGTEERWRRPGTARPRPAAAAWPRGRCAAALRPARCSSRSRESARCAPRFVGTSAWISSTMTVSTLRSASRALRGEQEVEGLGSGDQDVRRLALEARALARRRVSGADRDGGQAWASPRAAAKFATPMIGARRLRSTSTASAFSGET